MQFNKWDLVYSIKGDKAVSAQVDFETDDWKVYVSPWWKWLSYPERLILSKDLLFKKCDKTYHISKEDVNALMRNTLGIEWDIDNPPEQKEMKVWDQVERRGYIYKLEEVLPSWDSVFSRNWALYMFEWEEINKIYWTKDSVIKEIYWLDIDNVVLE